MNTSSSQKSATKRNDFALGILEGMASHEKSLRRPNALLLLTWAGRHRTKVAAVAITLGAQTGHLNDIARRYKCRPRSIYKQIAKLKKL